MKICYIKNLLSLLLISNLSYGLGIRINNKTDIWYGKCYRFLFPDTFCIAENQLSIRIFNQSISGDIDVLYHNYFNGKSETNTYILWKSIDIISDKYYVKVGNFYHTVGGGLIIGMQPDELLSLEKNIEGIKIETNLGKINLSQVYGKMKIIDRFRKSYNIINDTNDNIFNGTAKINVNNLSIVSNFTRLKQEDTLYTNAIGIDFAFSNKLFSCYLSAARKIGYDKILFSYETGNGFFANIDISYLNIQIIRYKNLAIGDIGYRYNLLPIVNHSGYSINNGLDEIGYSTYFGKTIKQITFDFGISRTHSEKGKNIIEYISNMYYGHSELKIKYLFLKGRIDPHFEIKKEFDAQIHFNIKNIEGEFLIKRVQADTEQFVDLCIGASIPIISQLFINLNYTIRDKEVKEESIGRKWYSIEVKYEPTSELFINLWLGKEKGGIVCSGGICKYVEPFDGVKLTLNFTM